MSAAVARMQQSASRWPRPRPAQPAVNQSTEERLMVLGTIHMAAVESADATTDRVVMREGEPVRTFEWLRISSNLTLSGRDVDGRSDGLGSNTNGEDSAQWK